MAAIDGRAAALHDGALTYTFADLADRTARAATVVAELTAPDERMAVIGENHAAWIECFGGASRAGRTLVLLNHRLAPAELAAILRRSGATGLLGSTPQLERLAPVLGDTGVRATVDLDQWEASVDTAAPMQAEANDEDAAAWIIYTSGTTGAPKGATLTHASLAAAVAATNGSRPIDPDDVYLFPFSLGHVAAYNVLRHHEAGRPVVLVPRFDAARVSEAIERHRVTSMSVAATMLSSLLDHLEATGRSLPSLRSLAYGAAPMPAALLRRADERLDVDFAQGYGMTELSGNAAFLDGDAHRRGLAGDDRLLHAAGWAAPGVELSVVDAEDRPQPPGRPGEVVVRAAQVMAGYWDDAVATADALRGGWLHTGDLGRIDDDGLLTILDRVKDVIVTGGENVSSLEVEEALRSHPAVRDVAVVGVPDPVWGENVCAVVVASPGAVVDGPALAAHVRDRLAGFKVPRHVVAVDALPVNAAGKVVKATLRQRFRDDPSELGERA